MRLNWHVWSWPMATFTCHRERQETPKLSISRRMTKQVPDTHSMKYCAAFRAWRLRMYWNDHGGQDENPALLWAWQTLHCWCETEAAGTPSAAPTTKGYPGVNHVCIHQKIQAVGAQLRDSYSGVTVEMTQIPTSEKWGRAGKVCLQGALHRKYPFSGSSSATRGVSIGLLLICLVFEYTEVYTVYIDINLCTDV